MSEEFPAGVADLMAMQYAQTGAESCQLGFHAWTPWLLLADGQHVTVCARCGKTVLYGEPMLEILP
jgi:hypothetical protein